MSSVDHEISQEEFEIGCNCHLFFPSPKMTPEASLHSIKHIGPIVEKVRFEIRGRRLIEPLQRELALSTEFHMPLPFRAIFFQPFCVVKGNQLLLC